MKLINITNLHEFTALEIFEFIKTHLLNQKQRSIDSEGRCVYRNDKGFTCAAGCLIPKELYDPSIEGKNYTEILYTNNTFSKSYITLITSLQNLHDYSPIDLWRKELNNFIEKNEYLFT